MNKDQYVKIEGTITLADGTVSSFDMDASGLWHQWGADRERLGRTVAHMDAISEGLMESDLIDLDES